MVFRKKFIAVLIKSITPGDKMRIAERLIFESCTMIKKRLNS